jgi:L-fucose mutarotase/ribose pyranase (RbsD/FucU family)
MIDEKPASKKRKFPVGRFVIGFVAASVLWGGVAWWVMGRGGLSDGPPKVLVTPLRAPAVAPMPANAPSSDEALAVMVAQELQTLGVEPKTAVVPSDEAYEAAAAIKRGDYAAAANIAQENLARSRMQRWHFSPFNDFMGSITHTGTDAALQQHLSDWVEHEPKSAMAYLVRAMYYHRAAWAARGEGAAENVPEHLAKAFQDDLDLATADVRKSIGLNPGIPWSYYLLLEVVSGNANSPRMEAAFQSGKKAYPDYYELYRRRLYSLTPKWGGSIKDMYAFVDQNAGRAQEGSPLKLLYLQLYAYLVDAAAYDCGSFQNDVRKQCMTAALQRSVTPALADGMLKSLRLYKVSDPIEFNDAVWPILRFMNTCGCESTALGAVLQTAASIMGSDNRMVDESGHNNYVLDDIIAQVWARAGNTMNADQKFKEALKDVERTSFPDEAQKDEAMAAVYDDMTNVADTNAQYLNIIVYHDAANAVGGSNHGSLPHLKCYAYYRMRHLAAAVRECTQLIEGNSGYLETYYYRAKAYEVLGQWDASLADFGPIAESANNYYRVGAALDMSFDYGQKRDYAGELASLNQHAYLFDPRLQPPEDLAVSYNNRCYAHMKLGELQKALSDCTASLKYGQIPDAYHKQQELMKMLDAKATSRL